MSYVFKRGDPPAICQRCGFKRNVSQIRREWTGLRVCKECYETRHPQEFVKGVPDRQQVPGGPLPEPTDTFVEPAAQRGEDL